MSVDLWCWFSWVHWRIPLRRRTDLLPSVLMCVQCCPPNVSCLLECVGVAVSDLCACIEVVWRVWLCPELQAANTFLCLLYMSWQSHGLWGLRLGFCPRSLPYNSLTVSVCVCLLPQLKEMCRRELDKSESEIKKNGSIIGEYKQVCTLYLKLLITVLIPSGLHTQHCQPEVSLSSQVHFREVKL